LAKVLGVNPRRISVVAGQDRSKKLVSIIDIEPGTVQKLIQKEIR
jgi:uncharacterized protein YggU (UPF0235/DUF167 family)